MNVLHDMVRLSEGWASADRAATRSVGIWALFALKLLPKVRDVADAVAPWAQEPMKTKAAVESVYRDELAKVEADFERCRLRNRLGGMGGGRHAVVEMSEAQV